MISRKEQLEKLKLSRENEACRYDVPFGDGIDLSDWVIALRRWLHSHPELSYKEFNTAEFVMHHLSRLGLSDVRRVGETGVVAVIPGTNRTLPKVALRADMDALPIEEETGLAFSSCNRGVMHACGHDGHTAMLLGAISLLQNSPQLPTDVVCLFQPAEEKGSGARELVEKGVLEGVEAVFGGHIDTHFAMGQITVDEGVICAFADQFHIRVKGRGGHAARPHESVDALVAASWLVTTIQNLVAREVDPNHAAVVTIGRFVSGTAANVIAEDAVLEGTVRTTDEQVRERVLDGLRRFVETTATMYGVQTWIEISESLPAVINREPAVSFARQAALQTVAKQNVISQGKSSLGGEDFAYYQQQVPGCMVRYGAAIAGAGVAHSSTFDFDERVLILGAKWLATVAKLYATKG